MKWIEEKMIDMKDKKKAKKCIISTQRRKQIMGQNNYLLKLSRKK